MFPLGHILNIGAVGSTLSSAVPDNERLFGSSADVPRRGTKQSTGGPTYQPLTLTPTSTRRRRLMPAFPSCPHAAITLRPKVWRRLTNCPLS
jgi:hypothetical protein